MDLPPLTLEIEQHIEINTEIGKAFEGLLSRLTDRNTLPMRLEAGREGGGSATSAKESDTCGGWSR